MSSSARLGIAREQRDRRRSRGPACRSRTAPRPPRRTRAARRAAARRRSSPSIVVDARARRACAPCTRQEHTSCAVQQHRAGAALALLAGALRAGQARAARAARRAGSRRRSTSASRGSPLTVSSILIRGTSRARGARARRARGAGRRRCRARRRSGSRPRRRARRSRRPRRAARSTRRATGPAEPNAARSSPRSRSALRASEQIEITIALRGPIFMNVCGAREGRTRTPVTSSSALAARCASGRPGTRRAAAPASRARSRARSRAPSTSSGGSASPAGDAVPRLPPIVPRLRICGEPTLRDGGGQRRQPRRELAAASPPCRSAAAPSTSSSPSRCQPRSSATRPRSISASGRSPCPPLSKTMRSVPPAIGRAPGSSDANPKRLLKRAGSKDSTPRGSHSFADVHVSTATSGTPGSDPRLPGQTRDSRVRPRIIRSDPSLPPRRKYLQRGALWPRRGRVDFRARCPR